MGGSLIPFLGNCDQSLQFSSLKKTRNLLYIINLWFTDKIQEEWLQIGEKGVMEDLYLGISRSCYNKIITRGPRTTFDCVIVYAR